MTRESINRYIKSAPGFIKRGFELKELRDLSNEPYELVSYENETYHYYPGIPGVLVGEKLVLWETDKDDVDKVDVHNPEHFAEILRRGRRLQYNKDIIGVVNISRSGRMNVSLTSHKYLKPDYSKSIQVDNTEIYYNPDDIDLENNGGWKIAAKALFLSKRYYREYIIPYKGVTPEEWGLYD